jgi:hypothetical protein
MPTKTKKSTEQGALPGESFKPGPAELPADPAPKHKLPTAAALTQMGDKFALHAENLRALLADVLALAELGWPISDPDHDRNLAEQIEAMLRPQDFETHGAKIIECDLTLAATIADVDEIADDLNPGSKQAEWARAILLPNVSAEHPKPAGTPAKGRPKSK